MAAGVYSYRSTTHDSPGARGTRWVGAFGIFFSMVQLCDAAIWWDIGRQKASGNEGTCSLLNYQVSRWAIPLFLACQPNVNLWLSQLVGKIPCPRWINILYASTAIFLMCVLGRDWGCTTVTPSHLLLWGGVRITTWQALLFVSSQIYPFFRMQPYGLAFRVLLGSVFTFG